MTGRSRIILALGSLLLLALFVLPMWKVRLEAPQYPQGLGMYIWIDTVTGVEKNDLQNINGLNHYIGMKVIEPDTIPELRFMPWIIVGIVVLGLAAALGGKKWMLYTWTALFLIVALVGLYDFYSWGYDYGHDLDPHAIIKIPGMTYQPPVIGSKKLLNFTAHSWPAIGGWMAFVSLSAGMGLSVYEFLRTRKESRTSTDNTAGM